MKTFICTTNEFPFLGSFHQFIQSFNLIIFVQEDESNETLDLSTSKKEEKGKTKQKEKQKKNTRLKIADLSLAL